MNRADLPSVRCKRQVVVETHDASLVINTDVDQIFVGDASPLAGIGLPTFPHVAGGFEDANIRKEMCDLLGGGAAGFQTPCAG